MCVGEGGVKKHICLMFAGSCWGNIVLGAGCHHNLYESGFNVECLIVC